MELSTDRLAHITKLASDYNGVSSDQLFTRPAHYRNANHQITEFFRFCAEIFAGHDAKSVEAVVVNKNLKAGPDDQDANAVSWLVWVTDSNGAECPIVYIDRLHLQKELPIQEAVRKQNHLLLHEIGHLVLHKAKLKNDASDFARPAYPTMEAEAWWFCYSILGICISECAFQNKAGVPTSDDLVWKIFD